METAASTPARLDAHCADSAAQEVNSLRSRLDKGRGSTAINVPGLTFKFLSLALCVLSALQNSAFCIKIPMVTSKLLYNLSSSSLLLLQCCCCCYWECSLGATNVHLQIPRKTAGRQGSFSSLSEWVMKLREVCQLSLGYIAYCRAASAAWVSDSRCGAG